MGQRLTWSMINIMVIEMDDNYDNNHETVKNNEDEENVSGTICPAC